MPNRPAVNGYTGAAQTQMFADGPGLATMAQPGDKGGMRAAGLGIALLAEYEIKRDTIKLARNYYKINKKDYEFFTSTHQGPMAATAGEAMSDPSNPPYTYDLYASVAQGMAKSAILDKQWFETRRRVHRYATGLQRKIDQDFALQRTHALVAGWNIGRRYEINWADLHNERRMNRKFAAANMGLGIGNIVDRGLAASVKRLSAAKDNLGDTISTIGNGLAARSGYLAARESTEQRYNERANERPGNRSF
jgi:hypothetical protein